jgi:hypothetical protein
VTGILKSEQTKSSELLPFPPAMTNFESGFPKLPVFGSGPVTFPHFPLAPSPFISLPYSISQDSLLPVANFNFLYLVGIGKKTDKCGNSHYLWLP